MMMMMMMMMMDHTFDWDFQIDFLKFVGTNIFQQSS